MELNKIRAALEMNEAAYEMLLDASEGAVDSATLCNALNKAMELNKVALTELNGERNV